MKIIDNLKKDFIEECLIYFGESVNDVLNEDIDEILLHSKTLRPGDSFSFYSLPLYVVVRMIKPENIIETGTQNGGSAQTMLYALHKNGKGTLHSIDSGDSSTDNTHVITIGKPGEKITDFLKERWKLHLGFSYDKLRPLLDEIGTVDLFFHDSDHSKKCIEFEFSEVIKNINNKSLVGLHDHYGQWDSESLMMDFEQIFAKKRPNTHKQNGEYHNVLRLWKRN